MCANGTQPAAQAAAAQPNKYDLNTSLEELASNESDKGESIRQLTDLENSGSKS